MAIVHCVPKNAAKDLSFSARSLSVWMSSAGS